MLPTELSTLLDTYDENFDVFIRKAEISAAYDLTIEIQIVGVSYEKMEQEEQVWQILIKGRRDHQIFFGYADFIELKNDHPLLWKYSSRQGELY